MYSQDAPEFDRQIFHLDIPVLGICYGMQVCRFFTTTGFVVSHLHLCDVNIKTYRICCAGKVDDMNVA